MRLMAASRICPSKCSHVLYYSSMKYNPLYTIQGRKNRSFGLTGQQLMLRPDLNLAGLQTVAVKMDVQLLSLKASIHAGL